MKEGDCVFTKSSYCIALLDNPLVTFIILIKINGNNMAVPSTIIIIS